MSSLQQLRIHLNSANLISILGDEKWLHWQALEWPKHFEKHFATMHPIMRCIWWSMQQRPHPCLFQIAACSGDELLLQPKSRRWWGQTNPRQPPSLQRKAARKKSTTRKQAAAIFINHLKDRNLFWSQARNLDLGSDVRMPNNTKLQRAWGGNFTQKSGLQEWMGVLGQWCACWEPDYNAKSRPAG